MVRTYNCSCNRNMYLWWCSNVYKRLQSFIWRYFCCAFLRFCLGIDSSVHSGVGKFGCIWLEWFSRGQGIWLQIFEKSQIPTLCPASPPRRHYIDRCITVYRPPFNPALQQIRLLQVVWILTSDWMKLHGSHAILGSYVSCCKTSLPWVGKTSNMGRFCCNK